MPAKKDMPSTIRRSPKKAQETWAKAHDNAAETYGEGERAHRTAFSALKHTHEKEGDRWKPKKSGKGPSDPQARKRGPTARRGGGRTYGGVDVEGKSKEELVRQARRLGVEGRSRMSKAELGKAIDKANTRKTAKAREKRSA